MRVLVLGGSGFVGREVMAALRADGGIEAVSASRRPAATGQATRHISLDTRDAAALGRALQGMDAVVNAVMGDGPSIAAGAATLADAVARAGTSGARPRVVHLSTLSVYGGAEGRVAEDHPFQDDLGWYGHAKIEAEGHMARCAAEGSPVVVLRPGCVAGPGSALWVDRLAVWLRAGRLGDLGAGGDGFSNLVDVADVAQAVRLALRHDAPAGRPAAFNLAAPDSPRWNRWFTDLAIALGATPVRRISARRMRADTLLLGVPLKLAEHALRRLRIDASGLLPPGIPPSLPRFWQQQVWLDATAAQQRLGLAFTPYATMLQRSVAPLRASDR